MPHPFQYRLLGLFLLTALTGAACVLVPWLTYVSLETALYIVVVGLAGVGALLAVVGWKQ